MKPLGHVENLAPGLPDLGQGLGSEGLDVLAKGYTGEAPAKVRYRDDRCFQLGVEYGERLAEEFADERRDCDATYEDGIGQGLEAGVQVIRDPSACSNAGYSVGRSLLSIHARDGRADLVGQECVDQYRRGLKDGRENRAPNLTLDNKLNACYMTGHDDGTLFR